MIADGLFSLLSGAGTVQSILGLPADRKDKTTGVFKVQMPESASMPALVFFQVAGESLFSMDGPDALRFVRYQFSCFGKAPADAAGLQRAVRKILEGFTGTLSDGSVIQSAECVLEMESFEDGPFLFHAPMDMRITFQDLSS